jgi:hypothetical protein
LRKSVPYVRSSTGRITVCHVALILTSCNASEVGKALKATGSEQSPVNRPTIMAPTTNIRRFAWRNWNKSPVIRSFAQCVGDLKQRNAEQDAIQAAAKGDAAVYDIRYTGYDSSSDTVPGLEPCDNVSKVETRSELWMFNSYLIDDIRYQYPKNDISDECVILIENYRRGYNKKIASLYAPNLTQRLCSARPSDEELRKQREWWNQTSPRQQAAGTSAIALRGGIKPLISKSDYPLYAHRKDLKGKTSFALKVGVDGYVEECAIVTSSGSSELDDATCRLMTRRARFYPGHDHKGKPIGGVFRSDVNWTNLLAS